MQIDRCTKTVQSYQIGPFWSLCLSVFVAPAPPELGLHTRAYRHNLVDSEVLLRNELGSRLESTKMIDAINRVGIEGPIILKFIALPALLSRPRDFAE